MIDIVDLFAGPGGWDEGLRQLGHHETCLGIEWDEDACATARAAGHKRLQADISELDPRIFGPIDGIIASPPCQSFSRAGKGLGVQDKPTVIHVLHDLAAGDDTRHAYPLQDARSMLTVEPLRWALALRPRWLAFEQVPAVLELWKVYAELLGELGYSVDVGHLSAECYGVPQTRKRAFLVARNDGLPAMLPKHTHSRYHSRNPDKLDNGVLPWISMSEALGWGLTNRPAFTIPATSKAGGRRGMDGGSGQRSQVVAAVAAQEWVEGPYKPTRTGAVRLDPDDGAILQGFPTAYPWSGGVTKQFQQIGNAVCPPVARAVLEPLIAEVDA